ncbi:MAG: hypothetical protein ABEK50_13495 [bacterium]
MNSDNRREHLRFDPEQNALAVIHLNGKDDNSLVGLLRDESQKGCAAVFHQEFFPFEEGDTVELKLYQLEPTESEIKWIQSLDEKLLKVGFNIKI